MLEYDEDAKRWNAMHHPFTSPKPEDMQYIESDPGRMRANAYDMVINGVEVGGGSIRIHDRKLQSQIFALLGMTPETAQEQFGFLLGNRSPILIRSVILIVRGLRVWRPPPWRFGLRSANLMSQTILNTSISHFLSVDLGLDRLCTILGGKISIRDYIAFPKNKVN
jgi:aspartyl-tRNA synthetase